VRLWHFDECDNAGTVVKGKSFYAGPAFLSLMAGLARKACGFGIYIPPLESPSQGIAVHSQFLRSSDLIRFRVSQNCNDEGLLKFPYCFGV
jgi:hypothetical protein